MQFFEGRIMTEGDKAFGSSMIENWNDFLAPQGGVEIACIFLMMSKLPSDIVART